MDAPDANRDPITGAPGAHPVGVGIGAAGGGAAGAAVGGVTGGPIGAAIGAAIGGLAGGLIGKGAGEAVNPSNEDLAYWRQTHPRQPYADASVPYEQYEPAYVYGYAACRHCSPQGRSYDEVERDLRHHWEQSRSGSQLTWQRAKGAIREGWTRGERGGCASNTNTSSANRAAAQSTREGGNARGPG